MSDNAPQPPATSAPAAVSDAPAPAPEAAPKPLAEAKAEELRCTLCGLRACWTA